MISECYVLNLWPDEYPKVEIHREERPGLVIVDTETGRVIYDGGKKIHKKRKAKEDE